MLHALRLLQQCTIYTITLCNNINLIVSVNIAFSAQTRTLALSDFLAAKSYPHTFRTAAADGYICFMRAK